MRSNQKRLKSEHTGQHHRKAASFVMTLWLEPTVDSENPEWRWRVLDVGACEERYFRKLSAVLAYVSQRSEVPPPA